MRPRCHASNVTGRKRCGFYLGNEGCQGIQIISDYVAASNHPFDHGSATAHVWIGDHFSWLRKSLDRGPRKVRRKTGRIAVEIVRPARDAAAITSTLCQAPMSNGVECEF